MSELKKQLERAIHIGVQVDSTPFRNIDGVELTIRDNGRIIASTHINQNAGMDIDSMMGCAIQKLLDQLGKD